MSLSIGNSEILELKNDMNIHLFPVSTAFAMITEGGGYKSLLLPCLEMPCICGIWKGRSPSVIEVDPKVIPKPVRRLELEFFWVSLASSAGAGVERTDASLVRIELCRLWAMR